LKLLAFELLSSPARDVIAKRNWTRSRNDTEFMVAEKITKKLGSVTRMTGEALYVRQACGSASLSHSMAYDEMPECFCTSAIVWSAFPTRLAAHVARLGRLPISGSLQLECKKPALSVEFYRTGYHFRAQADFCGKASSARLDGDGVGARTNASAPINSNVRRSRHFQVRMSTSASELCVVQRYV
jgi:hypothetical protein